MSDEVPSQRCGFGLFPEQPSNVDKQAFYQKSSAASCCRHTEPGSDRCVWHTRDDGKLKSKLMDINDIGQRLDRAYLSGTDLTGLSLTNVWLTDADLSDSNLTDADLSDSKLTDADLSDSKLTDCDLSNANLQEANLSGSDLRRVNLTHANITGTDLSNVNADRGEFCDVNGVDAEFTNASLRETAFTDAYLLNSDFTGAALYESDFTDSLLSEAQFTGAALYESDFTGAGLSNVKAAGMSAPFCDFTGSLLDGSDFTDADIHNSDFTGASATRTSLSSANATQSDFTRADLTESDLTDTGLEDSSFNNSELVSADFSSARLYGVDFSDAKVNYQTIFGKLHPRESDVETMQKAESVYRSISLLMEKNGITRQSRTFRIRSIDMRRKRALAENRIVEWLTLFSYKILTQYGESPSRVAAVGIQTITIFGTMYPVLGGVRNMDTGVVYQFSSSQTATDLFGTFIRGLILSISAFTNSGISTYRPNGSLAEVLVGIEGTLGILLVVLFAHILGQRFA